MTAQKSVEAIDQSYAHILTQTVEFCAHVLLVTPYKVTHTYMMVNYVKSCIFLLFSLFQKGYKPERLVVNRSGLLASTHPPCPLTSRTWIRFFGNSYPTSLKGFSVTGKTIKSHMKTKRSTVQSFLRSFSSLLSIETIIPNADEK